MNRRRSWDERDAGSNASAVAAAANDHSLDVTFTLSTSDVIQWGQEHEERSGEVCAGPGKRDLVIFTLWMLAQLCTRWHLCWLQHQELTCDHVMTPVLASTSSLTCDHVMTPVMVTHLWSRDDTCIGVNIITHLWSRDDTCAGFNIKNSLTCEVYYYNSKITAPVSGCTFYKVCGNLNLTCNLKTMAYVLVCDAIRVRLASRSNITVNSVPRRMR